MRPRPSAIGWMRSHARPDVSGPVSTIEDLGIERVFDYPVYDNGRYIVIDTVKDLVWMIVERKTMTHMREVKLDKYEAIRVADEFKESDERYESESAGIAEAALRSAAAAGHD